MDWRQNLITNLLSAETRRRQRNLEIIAVTSLLVVLLDLIPTRVSALGVELDKPDQRGVLWALLIFVCAFLVLFVIFALSDLARAREGMGQVQQEIDELTLFPGPRKEWIRELIEGRRQPEHSLDEDINNQVAAIVMDVVRIRNNELIKVLGWLRLLVEFIVPLALGITAIILLALKL